MATKIRGITLQIGGDTSGLEKSLKSANNEIKSTEKQLKDVEKLLKLDPTNTELLAQKQQLLKKRVEETKGKLDELKKAQKQFIDDGGDLNSEGYQALSREIISTESAFKEASKESNSFNGNLEVAKGKLSAVSEKAAEVAEKTKALSIAGAAVVGALGSMAYKTITASDDLNTLAQQSGLTTEEIQKFEYASDLVDVSTEDIVSSLKKMRKNMDSTSSDVKETWAALGVSVTDANGNFKESTSVFYETLEALSQVENETQRDIYAMALFGKNADSLAGIVDDGGKNLRELGDQASNLGLILSQDTLDSLNEMNDQLDILKANFKQVFAQTGAKLVKAFTPLLTKVVNAIQKVGDFIANLDEKTLKTITTIAAIIATISPIAAIVSKITAVASALIPVIATINAVIMANPIVLIIAAIVAAVTALTIIIIRNWDTIKAGITTAINWVKETFQKVKDWFNEKIIKPIGNFFIGIINKAIDALNFLIRGLNKIKISLPSWKILGDLSGKSFGVNINQIANLPYLANGGIVKNGSAIVGESGAELLTVANGQATVRPLTNNGSGASGINLTLNNTFNGYTSAQGAAMSRDVVRQLDVALGRSF